MKYSEAGTGQEAGGLVGISARPGGHLDQQLGVGEKLAAGSQGEGLCGVGSGDLGGA